MTSARPYSGRVTPTAVDARRWWREPPAAATTAKVATFAGLLLIATALFDAFSVWGWLGFDRARVSVYGLASVSVFLGVCLIAFNALIPRWLSGAVVFAGAGLSLAFVAASGHGVHVGETYFAPIIVISVIVPFLFSLSIAIACWIFVVASSIATTLYAHTALGATLVIAAVAMTASAMGLWLARESDEAEEDPLTHAYNRRGFTRRAGAALATTARGHLSYSLAIFDLDGFKKVNDTKGHGAGDEVLVKVVDAWRNAIAWPVVLGRLGGDEFALAMPGHDLTRAVNLVETLRSLVPEDVTVSAGVAHSSHDDLSTLMSRADKALYEAKERGRNRTAISRVG